MCSLGTPIETVSDSGADVDTTVEPNVISVQFLDVEKHSSTSQVDSDISDSTSIATLVKTTSDNAIDHMPTLTSSAEPIKIRPKSIDLQGTIGDHTTDQMPSSPPSPEIIKTRQRSTDISLNSPSSQIVGTPFAIDNTRFEYPFPDANQSCGSGSSSTTFDFTPSSSPSSTSFPISFTSSRVLTQPSFPPAHHLITHPKMKLQSNPPIPPSLIKRRLRWNLKLARRKSSAGSQLSTTSDESPITNVTDGQQVASPPESPVHERL